MDLLEKHDSESTLWSRANQNPTRFIDPSGRYGGNPNKTLCFFSCLVKYLDCLSDPFKDNPYYCVVDYVVCQYNCNQDYPDPGPPFPGPPNPCGGGTSGGGGRGGAY